MKHPWIEVLTPVRERRKVGGVPLGIETRKEFLSINALTRRKVGGVPLGIETL